MDPFYTEPLKRAFYYPTSPKRLGDHQKKTALSSDRVHHSSSAVHMPNSSSNGDMDYFTSKPLPYSTQHLSEADTRFNESWPASEDLSSDRFADVKRSISPIILADNDLHHSADWPGWGVSTTAELAHIKGKLEFDEKGGEKSGIKTNLKDTEHSSESTLAKYIERFRMSEPLSREERKKRQDIDKQDFWWLSRKPSVTPPTPTNSSTPKEDSAGLASKTRSRISKPPQPKSQAKKEDAVSSLILSTAALDRHTEALQQQADSLLRKTEGSLNSSDPVVSTVGLGSDISSVSRPLHPIDPPSRHNVHPNPWRVHTGSDRKSSRNVGQKVDILEEWRRRRKRELLSEGPGSAILTATKPVDKEEDSRLSEFRQKLAAGVKTQTSDSSQPKESVSLKKSTLVQTEPCRDETYSASHHHFIASPSLDTPPVNSTSVPAHLHLSCDIISCPDEARPVVVKHTVRGNEHKPSGSPRQMSAAAGDHDESSETDHVVEDNDVDDDRSDEKTSQQSTDIENNVLHNENSMNNEVDDVDDDHYEEDSCNNRGNDDDSDALSSQSPNVPKSTNQKFHKPKGHTVKARGKPDSNPKQHRPSGNYRSKSLQESSHDSTRLDSDADVEELNAVDDPSLKDVTSFRSRSSVVGKKPGIPTCHKGSASPVTSAVGKAVNRLFLSSESGAVSSRDSWDSVQLLEQQVNRKPPLTEVPELDATLLDVESFLSDGEEFSEDEILQDLRRKRDAYIERLRQLESQLKIC